MKKLSRDEVLGIVRKLHDQLDLIYGDRLKGLYLYGSYARGDARDESDIDVAVVLAEPLNRGAEIDRIGNLISDLCLEENCLVLPFILSEREYEKRTFAIFRSIVREGIAV